MWEQISFNFWFEKAHANKSWWSPCPAESSSYNLKCEYCHKLFRYRPMLEGHRIIDTGEKPFYCEICGNNCAHNGSLRTHIKQNHDNNYVKIKRENPHECNVCGQKFDKSYRLKDICLHIQVLNLTNAISVRKNSPSQIL
jgi:hypothetical protein